MAIHTELKEGDTFYYILTCHHSNEHWHDCVDFTVFAYEYHKLNDHFYDKELMFNTKEEAEKHIEYLINSPWNY